MTQASIAVPFDGTPASPPMSSGWDRLGIVASAACAVHCLAAPFLLLLLPVAGSIWAHPAVHWVLAGLVLPLAVVVVFRGYQLHGRRWALVVASLGAALIVSGLILPGTGVGGPGAVVPIAAAVTPPVPEGPALTAAAAHAHAPEDAASSCGGCCPSVVYETAPAPVEAAPTAAVAGNGALVASPKPVAASLRIPPAGIVTLIGSVLLVLAHAVNLHGCRCFRRASRGDRFSCVG